MSSHTAIFYTHNEIDEKVLTLTLSCFQKMVEMSHLPFTTKGVVVSCKPVNIIQDFRLSKPIVNMIAPISIRNMGHLSIVEKIELAMRAFPSDFVSLHEHDVLYPADYLSVCQALFRDYGKLFDYLAYDRIVGVNETGYVYRNVNDFPLSCLSFSFDVLRRVLISKRQEIFENFGHCYLEPGYAGSSGRQLHRLVAGVACNHPIVHVNMNNTSLNHHFTNHFLTYHTVSKHGFNEWPGDLSFLFS